MHIEKNICDNLVSTLLQDANKSKDDLRARRDLVALNIREDLHPRVIGPNKYELPSSRITMSKEQMQRFCEVLKSVKSPDGYSANISNNVQVQERKLLGLKTHDYHILLHQLLPVALRNNMDKEASKIIIEYCGFFRKLCSKVIDVAEFKNLKVEMAETMCNMEAIFPPSFFTVMVHLTQHLASEAIIAGPVMYRWMYPIERYLGFMKSLVRNRARPEGSIAESYIANECLQFASCYMRSEKISNKRQATAKENKTVVYPRIELDHAHVFILENLKIFEVYRSQHLQKLKNEITGRKAAHDIRKIHRKDFSDWVRNEVEKELLDGIAVSEEIQILTQRPYYEVRQYKEYRVNGYKFRTLKNDEDRMTQNCGIMGCFAQDCFSNTRDQNPVEADILYYGQLEDIVEIFYGYGKESQCSYVMFKVRWSPAKPRLDHYGFTLVNLHKEVYLDENLSLQNKRISVSL